MLSRGKQMLKSSILHQACRPKRKRWSPDEDAKYWCDCGLDKDGFSRKFVSKTIGDGVFTTVDFEKGDFLLEYVGERLSSASEILDRYRKYRKEKQKHNYMYHFRFMEKDHCIDATYTMTHLCQIVNDAEEKTNECNAKMRLKFFGQGKHMYPRLCLFASRHIFAGEQVLFDYGDAGAPWRKKDQEMCVLDESSDSDPFGLLDDAETEEKTEDVTQEVEKVTVEQEMSLSDYVEAGVTVENNVEEETDVTVEQTDWVMEETEAEIVLQREVEEEEESPTEITSADITLDTTAEVAMQLETQITFETKPAEGKDKNSEVEDSAEEDGMSDIFPHLQTDRNPTETVGKTEDFTQEVEKVTVEQEMSLSDYVEAGVTVENNVEEETDVTVEQTDWVMEETEAEIVLQREVEEEEESPTEITSADITLDTTAEVATQLETQITFETKPAEGKDKNSEVEDSAEEDGMSRPPNETVGKSEDITQEVEKVTVEQEMSLSDYVEAGVTVENNVEEETDVTVEQTERVMEETEAEIVLQREVEEEEESPTEITSADITLDTTAEVAMQFETQITFETKLAEGKDKNSEVEDSAEEDGMSDIFPHLQTENPTEINDVKPFTAYPDVHIPVYTAENNTRRYDKRQACYWCEQLKSKMARHLKSVHNSEPEVQRIMALDKDTVAFELEKYRLLGNFQYNIGVLKRGFGDLIVSRRPTVQKVAEDYLPCIHCHAFIDKSELWRHVGGCDFNEGVDDGENSGDDEEGSTDRGTSITTKCRMLLAGGMEKILSDGETYEDLKRDVLLSIRPGPLKYIIERDQLLLIFGSILLEKGGKSKKYTISSKLRQIAKLLLELRNTYKQLTVFDALSCKYFDDIVNATKSLCGPLNCETMAGVKMFKVPSLALQIGHSISKCIEIKKGQALRRQDEFMKTEVINFKELFESEWTDKISTLALQTLKERKYGKEDLLPLTSDLVKLSKYVARDVQEATFNLQESKSKKNWTRLCKALFVAITLFNKRRGGEMARVYSICFTNRPQWGNVQNSEMVSCLSSIERKLLQRFDMMQIPGKRNRRVPVILKPSWVDGLQLLESCRHDCLVRCPYMFAVPGRMSHVNAWQVLNKYAVDAQCERADLVFSTNLRRYTATVTQLLSLSEGELEWLSNHLGHHVDIHRTVYRQHESTIELAKISKLLMAVERGEVCRFKGKSLHTIELDDIPMVCPSSEEIQDVTCTSGQSGSVELPKSAGEQEVEEDVPVTYRKRKRGVNHRRPVISDTSEEDGATDDQQSYARKTSDVPVAYRKRKRGLQRSRPVISEESDEDGATDDQQSYARKTSEEPPKKQQRRIKWSAKEIHCVKTFFKTFIQERKIPKNHHIAEFQSKFPFIQRTAVNLKSRVQYFINQAHK